MQCCGIFAEPNEKANTLQSSAGAASQRFLFCYVNLYSKKNIYTSTQIYFLHLRGCFSALRCAYTSQKKPNT